MKPSINLINIDINKVKNKKRKWKNIFNNIYNYLIDSKDDVDSLLKLRIKKGEIKDINQARKTIVGNAFSNLIIYTFIKNKIYKNIRQDIYVTSKKSDIKNFNEISTIKVGNETQKPDVDLVIYSLKENKTVNKCIILSLKTSLRERAGQTYKWKLLMEIATSDNPIKEKYQIDYNPNNLPLVCFATVNFYNEINNPQHRGMFKFFDNSFIGKSVKADFIHPLSNIVEYANENL